MAASALLAQLALCRLWKEMRDTSFPLVSLHPFKCSRPAAWQFLGRCPRRLGMEMNSLASWIDEEFWCCSSLSWPDVLFVSQWSMHSWGLCICVCWLGYRSFPRALFESDSVDVCITISGASHASRVISSLRNRWCYIGFYNYKLIMIEVMVMESVQSTHC